MSSPPLPPPSLPLSVVAVSSVGLSPTPTVTVPTPTAAATVEEDTDEEPPRWHRQHTQEERDDDEEEDEEEDEDDEEDEDGMAAAGECDSPEDSTRPPSTLRIQSISDLAPSEASEDVCLHFSPPRTPSPASDVPHRSRSTPAMDEPTTAAEGSAIDHTTHTHERLFEKRKPPSNHHDNRIPSVSPSHSASASTSPPPPSDCTLSASVIGFEIVYADGSSSSSLTSAAAHLHPTATKSKPKFTLYKILVTSTPIAPVAPPPVDMRASTVKEAAPVPARSISKIQQLLGAKLDSAAVQADANAAAQAHAASTAAAAAAAASPSLAPPVAAPHARSHSFSSSRDHPSRSNPHAQSTSWFIFKRYSDFHSVHSKLLSHPDLGGVKNVEKNWLLFLPPKVRTPACFSSGVIQMRYSLFDSYVRNLVARDELRSQMAVLRFLGVVDDPRAAAKAHRPKQNISSKLVAKLNAGAGMMVNAAAATSSSSLTPLFSIPSSSCFDFLSTGDLLLFRTSSTLSKMQRSITSSSWDHIAMIIQRPIMSKNSRNLCILESVNKGGIKCNPLEGAIMEWRRKGMLKLEKRRKKLLAKVHAFESTGGLRDTSAESASYASRSPFPTISIRKLYNWNPSNETLMQLEEFVDGIIGNSYSMKGIFKLGKQKLREMMRGSAPAAQPHHAHTSSTSSNGSTAGGQHTPAHTHVHMHAALASKTKQSKDPSHAPSKSLQSSFFCSELVAACYRVSGLLPPPVDSSDPAHTNPFLHKSIYEFLPGDFSTENISMRQSLDAVLWDQAGVKLGEEIRIDLESEVATANRNSNIAAVNGTMQTRKAGVFGPLDSARRWSADSIVIRDGSFRSDEDDSSRSNQSSASNTPAAPSDTLSRRGASRSVAELDSPHGRCYGMPPEWEDESDGEEESSMSRTSSNHSHSSSTRRLSTHALSLDAPLSPYATSLALHDRDGRLTGGSATTSPIHTTRNDLTATGTHIAPAYTHHSTISPQSTSSRRSSMPHVDVSPLAAAARQSGSQCLPASAFDLAAAGQLHDDRAVHRDRDRARSRDAALMPLPTVSQSDVACPSVSVSVSQSHAGPMHASAAGTAAGTLVGGTVRPKTISKIQQLMGSTCQPNETNANQMRANQPHGASVSVASSAPPAPTPSLPIVIASSDSSDSSAAARHRSQAKLKALLGASPPPTHTAIHAAGHTHAHTHTHTHTTNTTTPTPIGVHARQPTHAHTRGAIAGASKGNQAKIRAMMGLDADPTIAIAARPGDAPSPSPLSCHGDSHASRPAHDSHHPAALLRHHHDDTARPDAITMTHSVALTHSMTTHADAHTPPCTSMAPSDHTHAVSGGVVSDSYEGVRPEDRPLRSSSTSSSSAAIPMSMSIPAGTPIALPGSLDMCSSADSQEGRLLTPVNIRDNFIT